MARQQLPIKQIDALESAYKLGCHSKMQSAKELHGKATEALTESLEVELTERDKIINLHIDLLDRFLVELEKLKAEEKELQSKTITVESSQLDDLLRTTRAIWEKFDFFRHLIQIEKQVTKWEERATSSTGFFANNPRKSLQTALEKLKAQAREDHRKTDLFYSKMLDRLTAIERRLVPNDLPKEIKRNTDESKNILEKVVTTLERRGTAVRDLAQNTDGLREQAGNYSEKVKSSGTDNEKTQSEKRPINRRQPPEDQTPKKILQTPQPLASSTTTRITSPEVGQDPLIKKSENVTVGTMTTPSPLLARAESTEQQQQDLLSDPVDRKKDSLQMFLIGLGFAGNFTVVCTGVLMGVAKALTNWDACREFLHVNDPRIGREILESPVGDGMNIPEVTLVAGVGLAVVTILINAAYTYHKNKKLDTEEEAVTTLLGGGHYTYPTSLVSSPNLLSPSAAAALSPTGGGVR